MGEKLIIKCNCNDRATVTLTKVGADILNRSFNDYGLSSSKHYTGKGESGYEEYVAGDIYTTELWDLMSVFGGYMHQGCSIPFVNNVISLKSNI